LLIGGAAVLTLVGCAVSDRPAAGPPSRDSAGIAVIVNTAPLWSPGHGWAVGESALVDITSVGAPGTALRLTDGRIVVATGQPIGLHYFATDGHELYTAGGQADGLGALRSLYHLDLGRGDTLVAFDFVQGRGVFFDPNGAFAGAIAITRELTPAGSNGFLPKGLAPDGRYLLQRDEAPFPFPGEAGTLRTDSTRLFWLTRAGSLADSSARLVAGELFGFALTGARGERIVAPLARPMAPALHVVGGRDRVWLGDGRSWEVRGLGATGALERIIRLPLPIDPLTPALRDTFIARYRTHVRSTRGNPLQEQFAAGMATAPFPERFPAYGDLLAGEDSTLWLLHVGIADDGPSTWSVLAADGRWLGEVTLPARFRPTAVGHGWVLGIQGAAAGGASVRLYPLVER
jgi:hypothetical protein